MAGFLQGPVVVLSGDELLREMLATSPIGTVIEAHHEDCATQVTSVGDDCNCTPVRHIAGVTARGGEA